MYFKVRKTIRTIRHPAWNGDFEDGSDIALLKLEKPLRRIALPDIASGTLKLEESLILTVLGWPETGPRGPIAQVLQHADLPLVPNSGCQNVYNSMILDSMLCAGGFDVDACKGGE